MSQANNPRPAGPPTWVEIKKSVLNYQAYLRTLSVDPLLRRRCFLLDKQTIDRLLLAGGNGAKGIRFYIGSEPDGTGLRLFPVACEEKSDGSGRRYFEDIGIPGTLVEGTMESTGTTLPPPVETRPCPSDCSSSNFLNPL
jgi:hypothetical protein